MYGPFPGRKEGDGLHGHVSGLLMPARLGCQHGVSIAVYAGIIPTASGANDNASIEPRCSQAMNEVLACHSIAPLCGL